MVQRDFNNI